METGLIGSLGGAMFIGVGACFLSIVIILSGVIGFLERKKINKIINYKILTFFYPSKFNW